MNFEHVAQALRNRLANYAALSAEVSYVGFVKPQDAQAEALAGFPYTVIEEVNTAPWDTKSSDGGEVLFQITTYCRPTASLSAYEQANRLAQAAYDCLHKYPDLVVPGSNVVNLLFDSSPGNLPDPDGKTRYRPMTFRVVYTT